MPHFQTKNLEIFINQLISENSVIIGNSGINRKTIVSRITAYCPTNEEKQRAVEILIKVTKSIITKNLADRNEFLRKFLNFINEWQTKGLIDINKCTYDNETQKKYFKVLLLIENERIPCGEENYKEVAKQLKEIEDKEIRKALLLQITHIYIDSRKATRKAKYCFAENITDFEQDIGVLYKYAQVLIIDANFEIRAEGIKYYNKALNLALAIKRYDFASNIINELVSNVPQHFIHLIVYNSELYVKTLIAANEIGGAINYLAGIPAVYHKTIHYINACNILREEAAKHYLKEKLSPTSNTNTIAANLHAPQTSPPHKEDFQTKNVISCVTEETPIDLRFKKQKTNGGWPMTTVFSTNSEQNFFPKSGITKLPDSWTQRDLTRFSSNNKK